MKEGARSVDIDIEVSQVGCFRPCISKHLFYMLHHDLTIGTASASLFHFTLTESPIAGEFTC